jgi:CheY-like chemotaxis protein
VGEKQVQLKDLAAITVMVVDDSAGMRQLMASVLQSMGVRHVVSACSGQEALSLGRTQRVDLYIIDWEMRPMDGLTLIKEIRKSEDAATALAPIIVLTAYSHPQVVRSALTNGANQFIAKPVVPQTLLNRMLWALNDKRLHGARKPPTQENSKDPAIVPVPAPSPASATIPTPREMWEIE